MFTRVVFWLTCVCSLRKNLPLHSRVNLSFVTQSEREGSRMLPRVQHDEWGFTSSLSCHPERSEGSQMLHCVQHDIACGSA